MLLYAAPGACSLAPHIVLRELQLPFRLVRVDNRSKRTADGEDFRAINPKGYVAALQLDDGQVLTEGPAILLYLADRCPQAALAPPAAADVLSRYRLYEWLAFINSELHAGSVPLFDAGLAPARRTARSPLACCSAMPMPRPRCARSRTCSASASAWPMPICSPCSAGCRGSACRWTRFRRWPRTRRAWRSVPAWWRHWPPSRRCAPPERGPLAGRA
ncbi:hypothetical protein NB721_000443 [Xanthomonas sacchari]|nr:hypothetical protein [Xanthomonas sacchari]